MMRQAWRGLAGLLAIGVMATGGSVALADDGGGHGGNGKGDQGNALAPATIFSMPAADGPPEGVAFDTSSGRFFVSRTGTGAIFSGALDQTTNLTQFIAGVLPASVPGGPPVATGLKVRHGLLYVAGASTGQVRVYDLANPTAAPKVFVTGGGFINDLDLDGAGDVFATDSSKPAIYRIDAASVAAGRGPVETIDTAPEIPNDPTKFNLNGIVARNRHELIVVQSDTGQLFRIKVGETTATRTIEEIELGGRNVKGGDGLLVDRGRLLVVQGGANTDNPNGQISVVKLRHHRTRGEVEDVFTDPSFTGPSTVARARDLLLVVNPNFANATTAQAFTVSGIARNAVRGHGGHGGSGHGGGGGGHGGGGGDHGGHGGGH